jgi:hypothetical protein
LICLNAAAGVSSEASGSLWTLESPVQGLFTLEHMVRGRIDETYPLAQLARPQLTLQAWRAHCSARSAQRGAGLLLAVDGADSVRGLCSYAAAHGSAGVLQADLFIVAHPFDPQPIVVQMLDELERLAAAAGCSAIELAPQDFRPAVQRCAAGRSTAIRPSTGLGL